MGDSNQEIFLETTLKNYHFSNILEIGSKDYGNSSQFRKLLNFKNYIGVDLESGKGVDLVLNLEEGVGPLKNKKFDLIILCSIIEHSKKPWLIGENIQSVLSDSGIIYSAHPWVWRYHKYPDDYFRFSPNGIKTIFDKIKYWLDPIYATNKDGDFYSFAKNEGVDNDLAIINNQTGVKYLPYLQTLMLVTNSLEIFDDLKTQNPEL
ncbi:MAG: hypothetical protein RLZZ564_590 [Pseudomonadota bacterium]|jgi:hypothetical protein